MIEDADSVPRHATIDADVAIIGAGAAGISLALALRGRGRSVVLLESGRDEPDDRTTELAHAESVGDEYPVDFSRLRYFGGSTNHWGGWCRPVSDWVMDRRPWIADVGWPFGRTELDRYYEAAARICELPTDRTGATEWSWQYWRDEFDRSGRAPLVDDDVVTGTVFRFSPPTRFAARYRDELRSASEIRVLLGANVQRIDLDEPGGAATGLPVRTLRGNAFRVTARDYVVAVGGLEVPRLLMLSATRDGRVIGDLGGHVGRWFMDHIEGWVGTVQLDGQPQAYLGGNIDVSRAAIVLQPDVLERERLGATAVLLAEPSLGITDLTTNRTGVGPDMAAQPWLAVGGEPRWTGDVFIRSEPIPQRASRVTLSTRRDEFGLRRAQLDWATSDVDFAGIDRTLELVAQRIGASGRGRMRIALEEREAHGSVVQLVGYHHMGGARMAERSEDGVVDAELRVHGTPNVSVLSSAVFPTVGFTNPTLTIVALAVRLADRLTAR